MRKSRFTIVTAILVPVVAAIVGLGASGSASAQPSVPGATAAELAHIQALGMKVPLSVTHAYIGDGTMRKLLGHTGKGIKTAALVQPAVTGICGSGTTTCWRQNPGITGSSATDAWPRDICCDANQQYEVLYYGQSPNTYCPEFSGVGVFAFIDNNGNGYPISAGTYSNGRYWVGEGANASQYWIWNSNGSMQNCWDARNGGYWMLQINSSYSQLYTWNVGTGQQWQQVHV